MGMYRVEEVLFYLLFGSLRKYGEKMSVVRRHKPCPPVVKDLDDTGTLVNFKLVPLQRCVRTPTIMPRFDHKDVLYRREVHKMQDVTRGRITL